MRLVKIIICTLLLFGMGANLYAKKWHVTPEGGDVKSGASWGSSCDEAMFVETYQKATAEDTFQLATSTYRLVNSDGTPSKSPIRSSVFGGYLLKSTVQRDLSEENLSIVSGVVSSKKEKCMTVNVSPQGGDIVTLEGIAIESARDTIAVFSTDKTGAEISIKKTIVRRAEPITCESKTITEDIDTVIMGDLWEKEFFVYHSERIGLFVKDVDRTDKWGCDVVIRYTLSVLPKSDGKSNYYVKQDGQGDGSSWANAMSESDFAYAFGRVEEGATFHIAEGVYYPIYDGEGSSQAGMYSAKQFHTEKSVNLVGGYPADVMDATTLPDTAYHTVLAGLSEPDETGTMVYPRYIMQIDLGDKMVANIQGITFEKNASYFGSTSALNIYAKDGDQASFRLESCRFNATNGGLHTKNCVGTIQNCQFEPAMWHAADIQGSLSDTISIRSTYAGGMMEFSDVNYTITNSTLASVTDKEGSNKVHSIKGSTIGSLSTAADSRYVLLGNIFYKDIYVPDDLEATKVASNCNIYPSESSVSVAKFVASKSEYMLTGEQMNNLLENVDGTYIAAYNGGETKTIRLLSDTIPTGISLRIAQSIIGEPLDQTGKVRSAQTCRGAYEYVNEVSSLPVVSVDGISINEIISEGSDAYIYDILGRDIAHTREGWEAIANQLKPGQYFYRVVRKDGKQYKGRFEITSEK